MVAGVRFLVAGAWLLHQFVVRDFAVCAEVKINRMADNLVNIAANVGDKPGGIRDFQLYLADAVAENAHVSTYAMEIVVVEIVHLAGVLVLVSAGLALKTDYLQFHSTFFLAFFFGDGMQEISIFFLYFRLLMTNFGEGLGFLRRPVGFLRTFFGSRPGLDLLR